MTILISELGFEIDGAYHPDERVATAPVVQSLVLDRPATAVRW